jgi:hypothetical protein
MRWGRVTLAGSRAKPASETSQCSTPARAINAAEGWLFVADQLRRLAVAAPRINRNDGRSVRSAFKNPDAPAVKREAEEDWDR